MIIGKFYGKRTGINVPLKPRDYLQQILLGEILFISWLIITFLNAKVAP